jgi:hypothetical protein
MTIKPVADGFGIFDESGKQVMWCYTQDWANNRIQALEAGKEAGK